MLDLVLDLELPSAYRQRALANLTSLIRHAETSKARRLQNAERLAAARRSREQTATLLRRTEDRLALLCQSRRSLVGDQPHQAADA